jgi:hypothetical protein
VVVLMLWPRWRAMVGFGVLFVAGLAAAAAVGQALTGGWFLWHVVVANENPFTLEYVAAQLGAFLQFNGVILLLAGALFSLPGRPAERPWRLYFGLTLAQALLSMGKVGASSNYWLEWTGAASVLIGILATRVRRRPSPWPGWFAGGLLGALLVAVPGYQATAYEALRLHVKGTSPALEGQVRAAQMLASEPGEVLTDDPGAAVAAGKPVLFEAVIYTVLTEQGLWDQRPILEAIQGRRFGLVVLQESLDDPVPPIEMERVTPAVRAALKASYTLADYQSGHWFYRPTP